MGSRAHGLQQLAYAGSVVAVLGLNSFGPWVSCPAAYGISVPGPGIKPESPTLAGRFLITGPSEKSLECF